MIRRVFGILGISFLAVVIIGGAAAWRGLGHRAQGERRARMERSPQWKDGAFENPQPLWNDFFGMFSRTHVSAFSRPSEALAVDAIDPKRFATPPVSGLRITWFGHSSTLIEIDGKRVLTDPVWSERTSPVGSIGPQRFVEPLVALEALPKIDAVLISHDHYDHLDADTITALKDSGAMFIVPLGVGAHLEYWGVPEARISERDWWEPTRLGDLEIVTTPARHASGRALWDKDATLWASYALIGAAHRVYFSGDTGLFPAMAEIGERYGPFDFALIEVGQYHRAWPDWHIGPEQAVTAQQLVKGRLLLPMHWALFRLASHGWTEPIERVTAAAQRAGTTVVTPRQGESIEADTKTFRWWPNVPWETAEQHPIVSTKIEARATPR